MVYQLLPGAVVNCDSSDAIVWVRIGMRGQNTILNNEIDLALDFRLLTQAVPRYAYSIQRKNRNKEFEGDKILESVENCVFLKESS